MLRSVSDSRIRRWWEVEERLHQEVQAARWDDQKKQSSSVIDFHHALPKNLGSKMQFKLIQFI